MYKIMASLFKLNIVLFKETNQSQMTSFPFEPVEILRTYFLQKQCLSTKTALVGFDENKGWKMIYTLSDCALIEKLNSTLNAQIDREEEVKREYPDNYLSENVDIDCPYCRHIRRGTFLSFMRKEIPGFGIDYSVQQYYRRAQKLQCQHSKPLNNGVVMRAMNHVDDQVEVNPRRQRRQREEAKQYQNAPLLQPSRAQQRHGQQRHASQQQQCCTCTPTYGLRLCSLVIAIIVGVIVGVTQNSN